MRPVYLVSLFILLSCTGNQTDETTGSVNDSTSSIVSLSPEQLEYAGITTTRLQKRLISEIVECNGSIEADPNQIAMISPPMKGYLKKILVHMGEFVTSGSVLAILEHPGYVDLQQEYLEVKSQYNYYKEDFKRQGELSLENAASIKKMQQAQNEFRKVEARYYSLKKHLDFIGINADSLHVDNIRTYTELIAPISGYVTHIDGHIGKLCVEEKSIFHVVGPRASLLHLNVYEKDAIKVNIGQEIIFSTISDKKNNYRAKVNAVARALDESKTVSIHGQILDTSGDLLPGMFVIANILVNSDSVYAINNDAIITKNDNSYIFTKSDSLTFKPIIIKAGQSSDDYTEILEANEEIKKSEIVFSGAYYLFSKFLENE